MTMFESPSMMGVPPIVGESNSFVVLAIGLSFACIFWTLLGWKCETIMTDGCCPKRRARYVKCVKRCARRQTKSGSICEGSSSWSCPFECKFARIHMPAPLPFRRKKKSKKQQQCERPLSDETPSPLSPERSENEWNEEKQLSLSRSDELPTLLFLSSSSSLSSASSLSASSLSASSLSASSSTSSENEGKDSIRAASKRRHRHKQRGSGADQGLAAGIVTYSIPVSPTSLIDLALMQNWPQLLVNLKARKRDARQRDVDGLYPLHWAVSGAPPLDVVKALLKAYPGATKKVDSEGSNTLHFAAHYGGSDAMVELLLNTYPKAVSVQDKYGRSPLYHAVDKSASIDVLKVLARADPSMITTLCRPKNYKSLEKEGKSWHFLTPLYLAWVNVLTDKRSVESRTGKIWDKATLLLEIAYRHRFGLDVSDAVPNIPLVSAAIAFEGHLPAELAGVLIQGSSERELLELDPVSGKNALALVASSLAQASSASRLNDLIQMLLDRCSRAATALDRDGKTPLAIAAASGLTWESGLARLFRAAPDTLGWVDESTGLTPSLLAATWTPETTHEVQILNTGDEAACAVTLADPYSLLSTKVLAMRRVALDQTQKQTKGDQVPQDDETSFGPDTRHLSTIYQLLKRDPAWIITA